MASSIANSAVVPSSSSQIPNEKKPSRFRLIEFVRIGGRLIYRKTSRGGRLLGAALTTYALLAIGFFWLTLGGHEYPFLRYTLTFAGVPLTLLVPEVTHEQKQWVRIILLCIPVLGGAILQATVDEIIIHGARGEGRRVFVEMLDTIIQKFELERTESTVLEPAASVSNGQRVDVAFTLKANRVDVLAFNQEAVLLRDYPELATTILRLPEDPRMRLVMFERISLGSPHFRAAIAPIVETLQAEVIYLDLADLFRTKIAPAYKQLEYEMTRKSLLPTEVCERIAQITEPVRKLAEAHPVSGVLNHLGNMRLNCGQPDLALADLYRALSLDDKHVPVYDSLSYISWNYNKDSRTALRFADLGLGLAQSERNAPKNEFVGAVKIYESFSHDNPDYAQLISHRVKAMDRRIGMIQSDWADFMDRNLRRLKNDFSYYSALRLENRQQALAYIKEIHEAMPDNPAIQDTLGFVLMRFATEVGDLDRADKLFNAAATNPLSEPETANLANTHLQELSKYRLGFAGRYELSALEDLKEPLAKTDKIYE